MKTLATRCFILALATALLLRAQEPCKNFFAVVKSDTNKPGIVVRGLSDNQTQWFKKNAKDYKGLCEDLGKAQYLIIWSPASTAGEVRGSQPVYSSATIYGPNGTSTVQSTTNVPYAVPANIPGAHAFVFKANGQSLLEDFSNNGFPTVAVYEASHFRTGGSYAGVQLWGSRHPDADVLKDALNFIKKDVAAK
jgi:hypothetical protein